MTWDEIARIFEQLELMLIGSLRRNLAAHEDWEKEEGFDWPAWQALKLANLEKFRQQNQELMRRYAPVIDKETRSMLQDQFREGHATLKNEVTDNSFFGVNRRRNEALIEDMLGTEEKVESAALRMMDDVYRQTVNKTQLAMSAGAVNLPKAIDMATKDFLDKGINCIVYKNGSRHNIADYVQMALRTTATRSYLQGEAQKRQELGIDTVLVSQYGACSETCLPWQGKVYIDDVFVPFAGERRGDEGKSRGGHWYPLLSVAVKGGLFHPNCRHTLSTWYEGVSTLPKPMDARKVRESATLEAKQREMEREVRKWKRLAEGTQDPEKRKEYRQKVRESQKQLRDFIAKHSDVLRRDYWRESTHGVPTLDKRVESGIIKADTKHVNIQLFAKIPKEKFVDYAFNPARDPDKARAFKEALGYDLNNYQDLISSIDSGFDKQKLIERGDQGYGMRYEQIMRLKGPNGKEANVLTAWIQNKDDYRLTSVYVTKRKVKK